MIPGGLEAVLFDLDGTLIDSEVHTEGAVRELLAQRGLGVGDLDLASFHGVTWAAIEGALQQRYPVLAGEALVPALTARFDALCRAQDGLLLPGARELFVALARRVAVGIVTSSTREAVQWVLDRFALRDHCRLVISAADFARSKPDPECYLLAAARLGLSPTACLVFEDSTAGLRAAKAAGMWTVAVGRSRAARGATSALCDVIIERYADLPRSLADQLGCR